MATNANNHRDQRAAGDQACAGDGISPLLSVRPASADGHSRTGCDLDGHPFANCLQTRRSPGSSFRGNSGRPPSHLYQFPDEKTRKAKSSRREMIAVDPDRRSHEVGMKNKGPMNQLYLLALSTFAASALCLARWLARSTVVPTSRSGWNFSPVPPAIQAASVRARPFAARPMARQPQQVTPILQHAMISFGDQQPV